jgi:uncharacterized protein (DUF2236 family)
MAADRPPIQDAAGAPAFARFVPGTPFWQVNREWLISLGGTRAVLLELAHPLIAAGVAGHSRYQADPFGRLFGTLRTMTDLTFGDVASARRAARHFHASHRRVQGRLTAASGPFEAGTAYTADDPFLKLWVLATLIDSVLQVYERFVRPLAEVERASYYQDTQRLAEWLGLSPALMPATYADFTEYMRAMLASDLLTVGEPARAIVAALYGAPLFGALARRAGFVRLGLLPARLREAYGFAWTPADEARLARLAAWSRRLRPWLPEFLMVQPTALRAERANPARSQTAVTARVSGSRSEAGATRRAAPRADNARPPGTPT